MQNQQKRLTLLGSYDPRFVRLFLIDDPMMSAAFTFEGGFFAHFLHRIAKTVMEVNVGISLKLLTHLDDIMWMATARANKSRLFLQLFRSFGNTIFHDCSPFYVPLKLTT